MTQTGNNCLPRLCVAVCVRVSVCVCVCVCVFACVCASWLLCIWRIAIGNPCGDTSAVLMHMRRAPRPLCVIVLVNNACQEPLEAPKEKDFTYCGELGIGMCIDVVHTLCAVDVCAHVYCI